MENPYRPHPEAYGERRKTAQQEQLISLKDDSAKPPPTIGSGGLQGILFGGAASQPSKAGDDIQPGWGKLLLRIAFWVLALAIAKSFFVRLFH